MRAQMSGKRRPNALHRHRIFSIFLPSFVSRSKADRPKKKSLESSPTVFPWLTPWVVIFFNITVWGFGEGVIVRLHFTSCPTFDDVTATLMGVRDWLTHHRYHRRHRCPTQFDDVTATLLGVCDDVMTGNHYKVQKDYCNRTNFRTRFNFVYFVLLAESTKFSSIRKPCTYQCVSDTTVAVRKFLAYESRQTQEYEIFTRTKISAITVSRRGNWFFNVIFSLLTKQNSHRNVQQSLFGQGRRPILYAIKSPSRREGGVNREGVNREGELFEGRIIQGNTVPHPYHFHCSAPDEF